MLRRGTLRMPTENLTADVVTHHASDTRTVDPRTGELPTAVLAQAAGGGPTRGGCDPFEQPDDTPAKRNTEAAAL